MGGPEEPSTEILPPGVARPLVDGAPAAPALIGRTLGKLKLVEVLGKGGSGEVFRAEEAQLGRSAVIKVLRRDVSAGANRVERFLREAKLASRLDHPYAAHIYGFGAEPDGVLWIAMEYVKGMTLDELIARRGAMPPAVFGPLYTRLCEVVHTAHELGIVHRDIKGGNVMVIERAGQLLPKLLDFGIAKTEDHAQGSPGVDDKELTGHGVTLGSPHYMSPEQWERPSEVDGRADIYALGILAYRCVAGYLPFRMSERHKLIAAHLYEPPPPLPEFVPPALGHAILRALDKAPDARWQTAVELGDAIRRAAGTLAPETVPMFEPATRDAWLRAGPQPIADAVAHLTSATTTVEADAALRELVAITCRWLAVLGLSSLPTTASPAVREQARAVIGRDDGAPWLRLARAAAAASEHPLAGLTAALAGADALATLADRLDDRDRTRSAAALAEDVAAAVDALRPLEPLLAYQLVLGRPGGVAESWQGTRRRDRDKVVVWGELAAGEVALLDAGGHVVATLSPLAQVIAPLPSAEPELFLLWRSGRGPARLVAAPWGFERDDDAAGLRLAALSTEDSDTAHDPADDRSPYPGLAAYGVADADHFVGREREVESLANRLVRAPLIAVLGPSGVGKSSFIHAGLVPRLGEHHRILTMRPGRHPMHALAALPPISGDSHDGSAMVARLRELGESAQRGVVIVVDQLEELVTLCADPDERRRFAETLAAAADGPSAPVRVVATLRDDFATVIESEAAFRGRFEVFVLGTPPPEALRRIVIEPARRCAVAVDANVVDDMVAEVAGRPASLPLLSFTAAQLWQTRDRGAHRIGHDAYLALGGVAGALATYADQIYASLARRDQDTLRDVFSRLVAADGTRVPSPRVELEQLPGAPGVLAHLIDARLLVVRDDDGTDVVEIVHECLAERWPRLARWRSEDAADRALLGDVRAAARRWQDGGHRPDLLWRGQALAELRRLAAHSTALTVGERAFADAATAAWRRAKRLRRGIVAGVMVVLAGVASVMAYLGVQANDSRADAERSATDARNSAKLAEDRLTQSLVAQGKRELNDGRSLQALAYFAEALRRGSDSVALRQMIGFANRGRAAERALIRGEDVSDIAVTPRWIAIADRDGRIRWFTPAGAPAGELATGYANIVSLRRTGDKLVVTGNDELAVLDAGHHVTAHIPVAKGTWMAQLGPGADEVTAVERLAVNVYGLDGKRRRSIPMPQGQALDQPLFDAEGHHLMYDYNRSLHLIDLVAMRDTEISPHFYGIPAINQDGNIFIYLDLKHTVHVLAVDGKERHVFKVNDRGEALSLSPDGTQIGLASQTELEIYDVTGKVLSGHTVDPTVTQIVIRGQDDWSAGTDGVVRHYHADRLVASHPAHVTTVNGLVAAGEAIVSLGDDSSVVITRADEAQLQLGERPCAKPSIGPNGSAITFTCETGESRAYIGQRLVGIVPNDDVVEAVAVEPTSGRAYISGNQTVRVFDRAAKQIAILPPDHQLGAPAFADADHLLLVEFRKRLWRWTLDGDKLEPIADVPGIVNVAATPTGVVVGTLEGALVFLVDGKPAHRLELGNRISELVVSADRRWLVVQVASGETALVDIATAELVRRLPPGDAFAISPSFDGSGELMLRVSHSGVTIWERATGDELVFNLDLLKESMAAWFRPDGRLDMVSDRLGVLDIPRDTRPPAEIIAEIACRVPLRVVGSRLEPATPLCKSP